jgi:GT2 family glycosyltransferase
MSLPVSVVTVAFGSSGTVEKWGRKWSDIGAACLISDNGGRLSQNLGSGVTVLPFCGNTGFGQGINRAIRESETPVVLITNPDTLPSSTHSLETLLQFHSEGSLTSSITVNHKGEEVCSTGVWPTSQWVRSQVFRPAETLWRKDSIDWLQGSLIMVHRDEFLQLGGFAENYPLYFEDVDLCFRAKKRGMRISYCRESRFVHDGGTGSEKAVATRLSCFHWGMLEYFRSNDFVNAVSVRKMIIAKCILRLFAHAATDREAFKGYYRALQSVYSFSSPVLPGKHQ